MRRRAVVILGILLLLVAAVVQADENTDGAWQALGRKEYGKARSFTQKCLKKSQKKALQQKGLLEKAKALKDQAVELLSEGALTVEGDQSQPGFARMLANKELNDVATCEFIEAESLQGEGKRNEARKKFAEIAREYKQAYCWDPRGWYWNVGEVAQDKLDTMDTKYDYGDYRSETLTSKAWEALKQKDHKGLELYAGKCVRLYEKRAQRMKGLLNVSQDKNGSAENWALNDVATCYYIQAERYLSVGQQEKAREMFGKAAELGFAVCWDPRGWHWNVAEVAKDKLDTIGTKYEYGDYRSQTLTAKAWKALEEKDYKGVELFTNKCVYLFEKEARKMKDRVTTAPREGKESENWAMNDVATCYYLRGEKLLKEGKAEEAKTLYNKVKEYKQAVCWNPQGWYFNVAEAAQDRLDTMGSKYDYEDYRSARLVAKAWKALEEKDYKGVELYTKKCLHLFSKKALLMNITVKSFPAVGKEQENWALNDVATSYFVLGNRYAAEAKFDTAKDMYAKAKIFTYAVCWNPEGWYFKIGEAVQDKLLTLGTKYDFGDYQSRTLTSKAWKALEEKDYKGVELYARKCIYLFAGTAEKMKRTISALPLPGKESENWALNDVATCYYLLGEKLLKEGKAEEAKTLYNKVKEYKQAVCWNPQGWYFNVAEAAQDRLDTMGSKYDYEDYQSKTLTAKAWQCLANNDYFGLSLYAIKCIKLFQKEALEMEKSFQKDPALKVSPEKWALNDVGTSYFILGRGNEAVKNYPEAKKMYEQCNKFSHAICLSLQDWYFKVAEAAQDRINLLGTSYDYEDYRSRTLARKSWESLQKKDYKGAEIYARKCIKLYETEALKMQSRLSAPPTPGSESLNWALNDVGTSYYILGEVYAFMKQDVQAKAMYQKAVAMSYALCLDSQGWYWNISEVAQDKLELYGTPYDYGDYRSVTLTNKAWQALNKSDYKGVELYAKKCAYLFTAKAQTMQGELSDFAKPGFAPYYWALNDVGTCYFILGEACQKQGNTELAKAAYQTAIEQFRYAQCWDPRGWYWKVAVVAQSRLKNIK